MSDWSSPVLPGFGLSDPAGTVLPRPATRAGAEQEMKIPTLLLVSGFLAVSCAGSQTFKADPREPVVVPSTRLQLAAEMDPTSVRLGAPINLKLRLKNVSSGVVRMANNYAEFDYELTVTDSSGKEPPRTEFGRKLLRGEVILLHSESLDLQPGQQVDASLGITQVYQLSQPGTCYARAVRRAIFSPPPEPRSADGRLIVEKAFSNPVQFTIIP